MCVCVLTCRHTSCQHWFIPSLPLDLFDTVSLQLLPVQDTVERTTAVKPMLDKLEYAFREACGSAAEALVLGKSGRDAQQSSDEWRCGVVGTVLKMASVISVPRPRESWRDAVARVERWVLNTRSLARGELPDVKIVLYTCVFDKHISGLAEGIDWGDIRVAQHHAAELSRPLIEATACLRARLIIPRTTCFVKSSDEGESELVAAISLLADAETELRIREGDARMEQARTSALAYIKAGDSILNAATNDYESLAVELVWTAIDEFRAAATSAREVDIETDALAFSRIGRCFTNYLKLRQKGAGYYRRAIDLAVTLAPRDMTSAAWYVESVKASQEARRVIEQNDHRAQTVRESAIYAKLSAEIAALVAVAIQNDHDKLLDHVYATHPPKKEEHRRRTFKEVDGEKINLSLKDQLRQSLIHYHPDRVVDDEEWRIMTQEIYKHLASAYETYK